MKKIIFFLALMAGAVVWGLLVAKVYAWAFLLLFLASVGFGLSIGKRTESAAAFVVFVVGLLLIFYGTIFVLTTHGTLYINGEASHIFGALGAYFFALCGGLCVGFGGKEMITPPDAKKN